MPDENPIGREQVTIKDLSAALDLSITTISRALNGYSDVSAKTRERVQQAARDMAIRPTGTHSVWSHKNLTRSAGLRVMAHSILSIRTLLRFSQAFCAK